MIVQWCIKGLSLVDDSTAQAILGSEQGLLCNWWREQETIGPHEIRRKLTDANLDQHVNHFGSTDPMTGHHFGAGSPFISMSAGCVERDVLTKTNRVHRARQTALWFGSGFGTQPTAYLFVAWVILAPRRAVEVEGVAEDVRDLNTYRRYSDFQLEGEIAVKINLPHNQIKCCEVWDLPNATGTKLTRRDVYPNPDFTPPDLLSNVRELI